MKAVRGPLTTQVLAADVRRALQRRAVCVSSHPPLQHASACTVDGGGQPPGGGDAVGVISAAAAIAGYWAPVVAGVVGGAAVAGQAPGCQHACGGARSVVPVCTDMQDPSCS